jgi:hypothetical protein
MLSCLTEFEIRCIYFKMDISFKITLEPLEHVQFCLHLIYLIEMIIKAIGLYINLFYSTITSHS